jgi:hypothetical protein
MTESSKLAVRSRCANAHKMQSKVGRLVHVLSIALAAMMSVVATPGFARTVARPPAWSVDGTAQVSAAGAAALRECNARARPYIQRIWGVTELHIYRTCMAEHHQPE